MVAAESTAVGSGGSGVILEGKEEKGTSFNLVGVDLGGEVGVVRVCEGEEVCGVV